MLQFTCQIAFKEWAVVCQALATGVQSVIFRKGGIHEGRDGFRVAHRQFWLYPTRFHQTADGLNEQGARSGLLEVAMQQQPSAGQVVLRWLATVEQVVAVESLDQLAPLRDLHILAEDVLEQRFHYRTPGLFLLLVRVFEIPQPQLLVETPEFAGCKSWVELGEKLSTAGAQPILDDAQFDAVRRRLEGI
ncbi:MAG: DUF1802 family protein [Planctomycetota bacterium]|nr:DUF1802 family protein [Planctomycetota bacterium]